MRVQSRLFKLSAAAAVAGIALGPVFPPGAMAQPAPPQAAPDQATADPPERVGRLARMAGTVSFHAASDTQWSSAAVNYPVATGDSYWTEPNAGATLEVSASRITLAGGSEFDVTTLDSSGLQATLPQGAAYYRILGLVPSETWTLQTPRGQVTFLGGGRYEVVAGDSQTPTSVTVVEGAAQISGPNISLQVNANQTATIVGTDTFQASAGPAQRDAFLSEMLARERPPARPGPPPPPIVASIPGGEDLADYGTWSSTPEYGQVWYPQVARGWAPYRDGHWAYIPPWGWTWVDDDPWGFAPFHYGRWAEIGGRWAWTPGIVGATAPPIYAPALVTFFGVGVGVGVGVGLGAALAGGSVGWIPLGPREPYRPWYHASPRYVQAVNVSHVTNITNTNITNTTTINNFANRGAATVVPANVMAASRPVRQAVQPVTPQVLAAARPVAGQEPIRPTAATAGVTPAVAQRLHLAPPPGGAAPRTAPGPVIRTQAMEQHPGTPARPELRAPGLGVPPAPGVPSAPGVPLGTARQPEATPGRPAPTPMHPGPAVPNTAGPAAAPGPGVAPGAVRPLEGTPGRPALTPAHPGPAAAGAVAPGAAAPGPAIVPHNAPGGARVGAETPALRQPGNPPPGAPAERRPLEQGHAQPALPPAPRVAEPRPPAAPSVPAVHPEVAHPAPEVRVPAAQIPHPAALPRQEEHAPPPPRPIEHAAPPPPQHPIEHAAPPPPQHASPPPPPRPIEHAAPPPRPVEQAAPAPRPPPSQRAKRPGEP